MTVLDVLIEDDRWRAQDLTGLADRAAAATFEVLGLDGDYFEMAILACDDARIAVLNTDFRDKPQPTNVLSWPSVDRSPETAGAPPDAPDSAQAAELGDIAIAYDTCLREATEAGKPMADHVTHLLVHGILHLLGYDHVRDLDATLMERLEVEILGKLGLPDPY